MAARADEPEPISEAPEERAGPRQLLLPLAGTSAGAALAQPIARQNRVYVNRDLDLTQVDWLGFDMDYTLAIYRQQALDDLSVQLTVDRMIARGYPSSLRQLRFDTRFPIRGLLVDKRYGHVLKMDRFKVVHKGYHGLSRLGRRQLHELYQEKQIRPHTARYHWIDTLFSLSEVTSYSAIVDALEKAGHSLDFAKVFQDVRDSIDEAHREGHFYRGVTSDLDAYLERDPQLERTLHKFRSAGKRLFLLTNSPWHYTDTLMSYLLGTAGSENPNWHNYFDVVVVGAQKPSWFREGRPLLAREGEALFPVKGPLSRGRVYEGGNLRDFERRLSIRGSRVLYVGDHIYGDILRSKKESTWRTAMIIQELDAELGAHDSCGEEFRRLHQLEVERDRFEDELRSQQEQFRGVSKGEEPAASISRVRRKRNIAALRARLAQIDADQRALRDRVDAAFHPYWGSLLKQAGERSSFGTQIATYADVYMRRVSSLQYYSPLQHFRSRRDLMPHEH